MMTSEPFSDFDDCAWWRFAEEQVVVEVVVSEPELVLRFVSAGVVEVVAMLELSRESTRLSTTSGCMLVVVAAAPPVQGVAEKRKLG